MSDFFLELAARSPDAVIGWRSGHPVRHQAFVARVRAWSALARRTPGSQVALFLGDRIEFAAALLGSWQARKTVWLCDDTTPDSCVALAASADASFGDFPFPYQALSPNEADCCEAAWSSPDGDFNALVLYTSGVSGVPHVVRKRALQLRRDVVTLQLQFGGALGHATVVSTVSHHYIYGLLFGVLWPLAAGRPMQAVARQDPEALAHELGKRPSILVASPADLQLLTAEVDWSGAQGQLCAVFSSVGRLQAATSLDIAALLGHAPVEVYGSPETGSIAWRQRRDAGAAPWRALPGVEWRIDAGQGLQIRSPHAGSAAWVQLPDRAEAAGSAGFVLLGRRDGPLQVKLPA